MIVFSVFILDIFLSKLVISWLYFTISESNLCWSCSSNFIVVFKESIFLKDSSLSLICGVNIKKTQQMREQTTNKIRIVEK
jgi:hypothetical protein